MLETPKKSMLTLISIMLIGLLSLCLASSSLMNSVSIRSSGKIVKCVLFDKCDQIGEWKIYSSRDSQAPGYNTIVVDTDDKVEGTGSLKGTFAADAPNYGGQFYKSNGSFWDISATPLLRMWIKINQTMYSAFKLEIICDYSWYTFGYEILNQLAVGQWKEVVVDLRLPNYKPEGKIPDLTKVHRLGLSYWYGYSINNPQVVWWDNITLWTGPYIPPQIEIAPLSKTVMTNEVVSFSTRILGGETPYSYSWLVNGTKQQEQTSSSFNFVRSTAGKYNVTVVVTDGRGNHNSATAWVTVLSPPPSQPPIPQSLDTFKSEFRGMFITMWREYPRNWSLVADTCFDYGINVFVVGTALNDFWENGRLKDDPELRTVIDVFHRKGINVYILLCLGVLSPEEGMKVQQGANRQTANWLCFTKNATRNMLKTVVKSIAANYSFDGFIFDYIRWNFATDMCFCDECKAKFIADTGLSDVNWVTDVLSTGKYYWQFIEWRMKPIDEAVGDIVAWMKEENPNLLFGAAVFTAFDNCGNYWCMRIGQHTANWVDQGWLDFICPMLYSTNPTVNGEQLEDSLDFYTGGREGKVPVIPFITDWNMDAGRPLEIESFVGTVRQIKQRGADGWIIWAYWGPGYLPDYNDARPYLTALYNEGLMEPVWAIQNFKVELTENNTARISWTTTVPTASMLEYSDHDIFSGTIRYGDFDRLFHYKDIDYIGGKSIVISSLSTTHSFTISTTSIKYFRIQSIDNNGIKVTSRIFLISNP